MKELDLRCESCSEGNDKMERIYSWLYYPQGEKEISKGGCDTCITISLTRFSTFSVFIFLQEYRFNNRTQYN